MRKPTTSIQKLQIEKNRENKISIVIGSLFLVAIVSAIILGIMFPATISYSLEILRWSALTVLAVIMWQDVFNAMNTEERKQHQRSL